MSNAFSFDPVEQEGSNFELIPAGDYTAQIIEAVISQPKSGDGQMLALTWKICDGDYENRQIWQTLCYQHSNKQTQDIARRTLKDICTALDIHEQVSDSEVFKFKPARVRISIVSDKNGQFDDQNRIKRVQPLATKPEPTPAPSASPAPKATGPGAAPWKRSA
jgi:hypothetical protein